MEAAMINDVVLEGIVVKAWKFADDLLFRLACYRDPDLPQRPLNETQDAADYVSIRAQCHIQSRDYEEKLADFLMDTRGADLPVLTFNKPRDISPLAGGTYVHCYHAGYG